MGDSDSDGDGQRTRLGLGQGSGGESSSSTTTKVATSSKAPRLTTKDQWNDFAMWFNGQLFLLDYDDKFDGSNAAVNKRTYGLIASSISGEAVTVVTNANCVGNGFKAFKALEASFGDNRKMRLTHKLKDALTTKQPANQTTEAYLRDKKDKFSKVETAFGDKKDELWDYAKVVSLITNLHDTKLHDYLLLEAARIEANGDHIEYSTVENAAITFSDGKGKDLLSSSNLALGVDDKEKKPFRQV